MKLYQNNQEITKVKTHVDKSLKEVSCRLQSSGNTAKTILGNIDLSLTCDGSKKDSQSCKNKSECNIELNACDSSEEMEIRCEVATYNLTKTWTLIKEGKKEASFPSF